MYQNSTEKHIWITIWPNYKW